MIFNEQHIDELCDEMLQTLPLGEEYISQFQNSTRLQILLDFKDVVCVWAVYLRLALKNENYELAAKIKKCIQIEKQSAMQILEYIQEEIYEEDLDIIDQVANEIIDIIN